MKSYEYDHINIHTDRLMRAAQHRNVSQYYTNLKTKCTSALGPTAATTTRSSAVNKPDEHVCVIVPRK